MVNLTCPNCKYQFSRDVHPDAPVVSCPKCRVTFSAATSFNYEDWERCISKVKRIPRRRTRMHNPLTRGLSTYHVNEKQDAPGKPKAVHSPESTLSVPRPKKLRKAAKKEHKLPAARSTGSYRPLIPVNFGPYKRLEEISRGGMGAVYKALDTRSNTKVALKVLLPWGENSEEVCQRFLREAHCAEGVKHPGIVKVLETGDIDGQTFIAMELVEGSSLDALMRARRGRIDLDESIEIMYQVARALAAAHEQGIIHRDIKPGNILVNPVDVPKITDFGLARNLADETRLTQTGAVMGTPAYMSPEQADGKTNNLKPTTDVWSLGAVMYELLAGVPPFRGDTAVKLSLEIKSNKPRPPRLVNPKIPEDIETIILTCLRRSPADRYPSASELAGDLKAFLDGSPISAKPAISLRDRMNTPAVKKTLAGAVVSILLGLGLLGAFSFFSGSGEVEAAGVVEKIAGQPSSAEIIKKAREKYDAGSGEAAAGMLVEALPRAKGKDKAAAARLLGVIRYRQTRFSEAVEAFAEACRAEPENADSFFKLGSALVKHGQATRDRDAYARAAEAFATAAKLDPKNTQAAELHEKLSALLKH